MAHAHTLYISSRTRNRQQSQGHAKIGFRHALLLQCFLSWFLARLLFPTTCSLYTYSLNRSPSLDNLLWLAPPHNQAKRYDATHTRLRGAITPSNPLGNCTAPPSTKNSGVLHDVQPRRSRASQFRGWTARETHARAHRVHELFRAEVKV